MTHFENAARGVRSSMMITIEEPSVAVIRTFSRLTDFVNDILFLICIS